MKKTLYLIIVLFLPFGVFSQEQGQTIIDSLKTELSKTRSDTDRVMILNGLSEHAGWRVNENDVCIDYAQKALDLAKKIDFKDGMAGAYNNMGNAYAQKLDRKEALKNYFTALEIYKITGNKLWEGRVNLNIGITYSDLTDYEQAIKYYTAVIKPATEAGDQQRVADAYDGIGTIYAVQSNLLEAVSNFGKALEIYKKINNINSVANIYIAIGYYNNVLGNYPEALKNHFESLKIFEQTNNKQKIAYALGNIGVVYVANANYPEALKNYNTAMKTFEEIGDKNGIANVYGAIGQIYEATKDYDKALDNYRAGLKLFEEIDFKQRIIFCYMGIGSIYYLQGNYPEALKNYFISIEIAESIKDKWGMASGYSGIGTVYLQLNNPEQAKEWLQKSLTLHKETASKEGIKDTYEKLSTADSALGNFKGAYENHKMFIAYKDSLYNEENTKKLTQTAMQYEFDKQQLADSIKSIEAQNRIEARLQKQKTYTWSGAGAVLLLLGFLIFVFRSNKKLSVEKQKSENLLLNILPEEIADELKQKGSAEAKQFDQVSILFTDFINFTQTSENLNPQQLVQELNECFTAFDNIMERNGLEKIKTIGDAYLAVCGLPSPDPMHAQKTVQAALEVRDFIEKRKEASPLGRFEEAFEIRIGVHSGSVVAGIVGVKKFAYDIWGDTVNIAARMEQSGEAGKVNISETTHQIVQNDFIFAYRGEVEAKNKGKMKMYFVESKTKNMNFEKAKEFILEKLERELSEKLTYHNVEHIIDVYQTSVEYAQLEGMNEEETTLLKTASLFHDSGFIIQAAGHEQISCEIAQEYLPEFGYSQPQIDKIKGMIMATKIPQTPTNHLEQIMADSDLDYLGRDDFEKISERLFQELGIKDRNQWNKIQISFFEKHSYFTDSAQRLRNGKKQQNLEKIKEQTEL